MTPTPHREDIGLAKSNTDTDKETRRAEILDAYRSHGSLTDREVKDLTSLANMNEVRPPISGLLDRGHLVSDGKVLCGITTRMVRLCKLSATGLALPIDNKSPMDRMTREIKQWRDAGVRMGLVLHRVAGMGRAACLTPCCHGPSSSDLRLCDNCQIIRDAKEILTPPTSKGHK